MKLTSNLRLKFAKLNNTISITTRTYEKATFDQFLAASIVERCKTLKSANEYIDDVAGKGSMNAHLKKMVRTMREKSKEERAKILSSSLYPIEKIDDSQSFIFYPAFNKSLFAGILYDGNLADQTDVLKKAAAFDGELVSLVVRPDREKEEIDNYRVSIDGADAAIQIAPSAFLHADSNEFTEMVVQAAEIPESIKEMAKPSVEGEGWYLLTASQINGPMHSAMGFYRDGLHYLLTNACIKRTEIGTAFGLFLYREETIPFVPSYSKECSWAAEYLLSSKQINNFKTKSLVELLGAAEGDIAQLCINYVLSIKDSRELALLGLSLIQMGLRELWTPLALERMKDAANQMQLKTLYQIAPKIFLLDDLLTMDDPDILTPEHRQMWEEYRKDRANKIAYVKSSMGEVAGSALREKSAKLKNDEEVKEFRKLINKLLAHSKVALEDMGDSDLDSSFRLARRLMNLMPIIEAKVNEMEAEQ